MEYLMFFIVLGFLSWIAVSQYFDNKKLLILMDEYSDNLEQSLNSISAKLDQITIHTQPPSLDRDQQKEVFRNYADLDDMDEDLEQFAKAGR